MKKFSKRILAGILTAAMTIQLLPLTALAADQEVVKQESIISISNDYIQITVNRRNGGYYINTKEGDVIRKSDDNAALIHRGDDFDTSFTSFQLGNDKSQQYIFGNSYGFLGLNSSDVVTESDATGITSTWSVKDVEVKQRIELVNDISSEQLGTAKITYTLTNKGTTDISDAKARVLMDTMLGGNDSAVYEVAKPAAGTGYDIITAEKTISGEYVPADYFAKDDGFNPSVVAFGVNSILNNASKPSKMTFAHWVNIAATKFDYTPDTGLTFTNGINDTKTADSAAAMYYELGKIEANKSVTLSTYYGVTANLKNKANSLIINSTAPKKLILNDAGTAYTGEDKDNEFTIHTTISNTKPLAKVWKKIKAVVYTGGKLIPLSISDTGVVSEYDNSNPYAVEVLNFGVGESKPITFRFRATPSTAHELGSVQIKIFDVSETDVYVEENVIASSNNFILLPATVPNVPAITVTSAAPNILYNNDKRFLTITGKGLSNFNADGLQGIELRGKNNGKTYTLIRSCMSIAQDSESMTLMLDQYMEPGRYEIHFIWQPDAMPVGVDKDFTAPALWVEMTDDETYRNDKYGVLTMQRLSSDKSKTEYNKFKVVSYDTEAAFTAAHGNNGDELDGKLLITLRGEFIKDNIKENYYRAANNQKSISINGVLDYLGSDMTVYSENDNSIVKMDGKIITTGSRTTVRDGTAAFKLKSGTTYIVPQYDDAEGTVVNDSPDFGQQYIELAWDSGMDVLQTIGGFALNLKFGVLGEMVHEVKEDTYEKVGNVVSFGGSLDLSFMTPGGAQVARENKSKNTAWSEEHPSKSALDNPLHETETFEVKPTTQSVTSPAASINVQDVLYGQHKEGGKIETGYIGINAQASATLPQIVSFLHETMSGSIDINTIGDYRVGVAGSAQLTNFALAFSFVIKEAPNGAPVPDKLYFMIGGFEPGVNIDSLGVFWVTGGGGGFDKLYDTIFSSDGVPPFTLLLTVQFDIFKIMTGQADLELSLRSLGITLSDVSLKMIKNAKFLDGGSVFIAWYPNFSLSMSAKVMFSQIFTGQMGLNASAAKNSFEMYMGVGVSLPQAIPIIGGMNIAYAEIGGGMEKMWGMLRVLFIELGITYYWSSGDVNFGVKRSMSAKTAGAEGAYNKLTAPQAIDYDENTKQTEYMSIGSNLDFAAGSGSDTSLSDADIASFMARSQKGALKSGSSSSNKMSSSDLISSKASVQSNSMLTTHMLSLGQQGSKIISISTKDGKLPENFTDKIRIIKPDLSEYALTIYDGTNANTANANLVVDDGSKTDLNGTVIKNDHATSATLYVTIPEDSYMANNWLVEIGDISCDVGIIGVRSLAKITAADANIANGNELNVTWNGTDLDGALVSVGLTETIGEGGIVLSEGVDATAKQTTITVPDTISSGDYYVRVILSKEGECYNQYFTKYENGADGNKKVTVVNSMAPKAPAGISLSNAGNDKLRVDITKNADTAKLEGYLIDVYEDGALKQAAQYYDKDNIDNILIGGIYSVPVPQYNADGTAKLDAEGNPVTVSQQSGYTAGKKYKVTVRSAKKATDSDTLYCSDTISSTEVVLVKATPAKISIISPMTGAKTIDNILWVNNGKAEFTLKSETDVTGVWSIDGQQGGEFTTAGKSFDIKLDVPDGTHTIEFAGRESADKDAFIYTTIIGVDSTAPTLLLDNPINGSVFTNNILSIKGVVEAEAYYTFKVDGKILGEEKRNLSTYIDNNGLLSYPLDLGSGEVSRNVEIIAVDSVGNQTTQKAEVINSEISKIKSVYIAQNDKRITESGIDLEDDSTNIELQLIGVVPAEGNNARKTFDITGLGATSWDVLEGTANVENGRVSGVQAGSTYISASLGLTSDTTLSDAIPIIVPDRSSAKAITSFLIGSNEGIIDEINNEILVTVPFGTDVKALKPTSITVSDKATVSPGSDVEQNFTNPVIYTVTGENETSQAYTVTVKVSADARSSDKAITSFFIGSNEGIIDEINNEILVTVPFGTDVKALKPTSITVSDKATVSPGSGVVQNFTHPVTYTVTAQNETTQAYTVTVKVSDPVNPPVDPPVNPDAPKNNNNDSSTTPNNSELEKLQNLVELHGRAWLSASSSLTYEQVQSKIDANGAITFVTEQGTVELPKSTLEGLKLKSGETLSVTINRSLSPETNIAKGYYQVYLSIGNNVITNHGNVVLKLPYSSGNAALNAFNMNDKGEITIAPFSAYKDGKIHILTSNTGVIRLSESSASYKDVPSDFWGAEGILFASSHGLFSGAGKGAFDPNGKMTRGMLVTVLGKLLGANSTEYEAEFTDVSEKAYYAPYISWAAKNGLVTGVGNKKFNPDAPVSREQLMVVMYKALSLLECKIPEGSEAKFADEAKISSWAKNAVEKMSKAGVVSGKSGKLIDPQGSATRAEVATILMKFIKGVL